MGDISIAEKFRPFSHTPGTLSLIPGSPIAIQAYPCLIKIFNWDLPKPELLHEIRLGITGPVENFTCQCDLEKGCIKIWGKGAEGFFRYEVSHFNQELILFLEKWEGHESFQLNQSSMPVKSTINLLTLKETVKPQAGEPPLLERLSLGSHKAQDFDLVRRRLDLKEILPPLYLLSQWVLPPLASGEELINLSALKGGQFALSWQKFFLSTLKGILVPTLEDEEHQGIPNFNWPSTSSPLVVLKACMPLLRTLFFEERDLSFFILPALPPEFHSGRMTGLSIKGKGTIDIEWTKKTIRRLQFHSEMEQHATFHFKNKVSFRLRKNKFEKGIRIHTGESFSLEKNCHYFFDNFL